jgi:hypothetical protein
MRSLFLGTLSGVPLFSAVVFVLLSNLALADQFFETKRYSHLTPEHCQEFNINYFGGPLQFVTYSITGATDNGFTNGIKLARHEAAQMWRLLRDHKYTGPDSRWPITQIPRMQKILVNLETAREFMGFTYKVEGEILEALVLIDLGKHFDPSEYFFTGGIEYSHGSGRVLGELDIIVARRSDCKVVVVGESKLGLHRLNKAKRQLARFRNFLLTKGYGQQVFMYQ